MWSLALLGASLAFAVLLAELLLRVFPVGAAGTHTTFAFTADADVGYRPVAGQDAVYDLPCLSNPHVRTNREGLRGPEWSSTRRPRIALLGDSYLLALAVSERWHLASVLQAATGGEVWNAGVSGYGTYQELLIWRKLVRPRRPDVTVLFVNLENDVRDNHCGLCRAEGQKYSPCLEFRADAVVERRDFEIRRPAAGLRAFLDAHSRTWGLVRRLAGAGRAPPGVRFYEQESFAYNVYVPGFSPRWDEAWQATAWALSALRSECDAAGSRLLVVSVPGMLPLAPDWRQEMARQLGTGFVPPGFDLDHPTRRLRALIDAEHLDSLDLLPGFLAYRDRHQLRPPGFAWCCDGHWNPIGHRLAADLVHDWLLRSGWIGGAPPVATPGPEELLGSELLEDIRACRTAARD